MTTNAAGRPIENPGAGVTRGWVERVSNLSVIDLLHTYGHEDELCVAPRGFGRAMVLDYTAGLIQDGKQRGQERQWEGDQ